MPACTSHHLLPGSLLFRDSGSFIIRGRLWTLPDDALAAYRMRLSGSSTARPALSFWRRQDPVGWPLALMCFGPKHRSGCAWHVSTSGAKKRRNRDLSRKPHHTRRTSQEESRLFALRQSGAGISRVEGGSFVLARCEQMFAATNVCSTLAPEQPCPETTPGGRLGRGLEKPKSHFSQHLHAPQRDGVERASSP
jgi:hypothetical protein